MRNETSFIASFPPISHEDAKILILGSMPSVTSLQQQQYYAHPRNAFWPIMAELFAMEEKLAYLQRCEHLRENKVAVWDVLQSCQRHGSLDSNIDSISMIANDFNTFFKQHPNINRIFFNGGKAKQVFKHHILPNLNSQFKPLTQIQLPSTSPAHAAKTLEQKLKVWRQIQLPSTPT